MVADRKEAMDEALLFQKLRIAILEHQRELKEVSGVVVQADLETRGIYVTMNLGTDMELLARITLRRRRQFMSG